MRMLLVFFELEAAQSEQKAQTSTFAQQGQAAVMKQGGKQFSFHASSREKWRGG